MWLVTVAPTVLALMREDSPIVHATRSHDYDVAVIGSGIAGSALAAVLARHGVRVVVFEAKTHPRFSIGESMILETSEIMRALAEYYDVPELAYYSSENYLSRIGTVARRQAPLRLPAPHGGRAAARRPQPAGRHPQAPARPRTAPLSPGHRRARGRRRRRVRGGDPPEHARRRHRILRRTASRFARSRATRCTRATSSTRAAIARSWPTSLTCAATTCAPTRARSSRI